MTPAPSTPVEVGTLIGYVNVVQHRPQAAVQELTHHLAEIDSGRKEKGLATLDDVRRGEVDIWIPEGAKVETPTVTLQITQRPPNVKLARRPLVFRIERVQEFAVNGDVVAAKRGVVGDLVFPSILELQRCCEGFVPHSIPEMINAEVRMLGVA